MFTWMAAFCVGAIILYCSGILLPWYAYILFLVVVLCIPRFIFHPKYILAIIFFVLGHAYASFEAKTLIGSILPLELEDVPMEVTGYFCSMAQKGEHNYSAEFCTLSIFNPDSQKQITGKSKIILYWPHSQAELLAEQKLYRFKVKLKRPRGVLNPVGNSYEQYLFQRRIVAVGSIISVFPKHVETSFSPERAIAQKILSTRMSISKHLDTLFLGLEHAGLLKALLLGDRSGINKKDSQTLSQTGTQHLMAISGLHIGVILMLIYRFLPKSRRSLVLIALLGLVYVALVGFSTSAQRAWVMCVVALIYLMGFKRVSLWQPFILGLTVVLLLDPLAPLGMGFWYSFVSVALLLVLIFLGPKGGSLWWMFLVVQFVLLVGLAPVNTYFGLPHSLSNSLANVIAIPWVSVVVLPGALIALVASVLLPELSVPLFTMLNEILHVLMNFLSSIRYVSEPLNADNIMLIQFSLLLVLFASMLLFRVKILLVCLLLGVFFYFSLPTNIKNEATKLLVFDAGQGLALAIHSRDMNWLYDTGAAYEKSSVAQRAILPYLRANNLLNRTEGIIISHGDWDHAGGLDDLLSSIDPAYLWSGEIDRLFSQSATKAESCTRSMSWQSDQVQIEILYPLQKPLREPSKETKPSANNHSCVVRVTIGRIRFLLMGDLEAEAELELVRLYRHELKSDVLIAGHHGSNNASSYTFLKYVKPEYVVFSSGYKNRFGHPHKKVINRVESFTNKIFNTAINGALIFSVDPASEDQKIKITVERNDKSPFWVLKDDPKPIL